MRKSRKLIFLAVFAISMGGEPVVAQDIANSSSPGGPQAPPAAPSKVQDPIGKNADDAIKSAIRTMGNSARGRTRPATKNAATAPTKP